MKETRGRVLAWSEHLTNGGYVRWKNVAPSLLSQAGVPEAIPGGGNGSAAGQWRHEGRASVRAQGRGDPGRGGLPSKAVTSSERVTWAHSHGEWRPASQPQRCVGRERGAGAVIPPRGGHWWRSLVP